MSEIEQSPPLSENSFVKLSSASQTPCGNTFVQLATASKRSRRKRRQKTAAAPVPTCVFCSQLVFDCQPPRSVRKCTESCGGICVHEDCAQQKLFEENISLLQLSCQHCRQTVKVKRVCVVQHWPTEFWQHTAATRESMRHFGLFWTLCYGLLLLLLRLMALCCYGWLYGLAVKLQLIWSRGVATQWKNFDLWSASVVMDFQGETVEETLFQVGRVHLVCALTGWILFRLLCWLWHKFGLSLLIRRLLYTTAIHTKNKK